MVTKVQLVNITDPLLPELKGAAAASAGQVPVATGTGTTVFTDQPTDRLVDADKSSSDTSIVLGKLLSVGQLGLGVAIEQTSVDLNTLLAGFYRINVVSNGPAGVIGAWVYVQAGRADPSNEGSQLLVDWITGNFYTRVKKAGVYTAWLKYQTGVIGTDIQAYSANTVVDANYVATDENFTTADHSKLDGLVKTTGPVDTTAGSLLQVGDFGLGGGTGIEYTDANDVGGYAHFVRFTSSSTNTPIPGNFFEGYTVVGAGFSCVTVELVASGATAPRSFKRSNRNGTWTAWTEIVTDAPPVIATLDLDTLTRAGRFFAGAASTNKPVAVGAGTGLVVVSDITTSSTVTQATIRLKMEFFDYSTGRQFVRGGSNITWQPWREVYNQASTVGTVSESAGVPTGAIIERGSNANGEYIKYADGTLVCTSVDLGSTAMTSNQVMFHTWTLPHLMINTTYVATGTFAPQAVTDWYGVIYTTGYQTDEVLFAVRNGATAQNIIQKRMVATGRWF